MNIIHSNHRHHNKLPIKRARWYLIPIIFVVVLALATSIVAIQKKSPNSSDDGEIYGYISLGEDCSQGVGLYDKKIVDLTKQLNDLNTGTEAASGLRLQAQQRSQELWNAINQVNAAYNQQYEDGVLSLEELNSLVEKKQKYAIDQGLSYEKEAEAQIKEINDNANKQIEGNREQFYTIQTNQAKLKSCVDQADGRKEFTTSDVTDFRSIIADSKLPIH